MKLRLLFSGIILSLAGAAVNAAPADTTVCFSITPKMQCQKCEKKIVSNLRFEKGIKDIKVDLNEQTVSVRYAKGKQSPENLTKALNKLGYTATEKK